MTRPPSRASRRPSADLQPDQRAPEPGLTLGEPQGGRRGLEGAGQVAEPVFAELRDLDPGERANRAAARRESRARPPRHPETVRAAAAAAHAPRACASPSRARPAGSTRRRSRPPPSRTCPAAHRSPADAAATTSHRPGAIRAPRVGRVPRRARRSRARAGRPGRGRCGRDRERGIQAAQRVRMPAGAGKGPRQAGEVAGRRLVPARPRLHSRDRRARAAARASGRPPRCGARRRPARPARRTAGSPGSATGSPSPARRRDAGSRGAPIRPTPGAHPASDA